MVQGKTAFKMYPHRLAFYGECADYVRYENGQHIVTMVDARLLDKQFVDFIESRIKEGLTYKEALLQFQIAIGER